MTVVALLVATQALDVLGYFAMPGRGVELNPLVAVVGVAPLIAAKFAAAAVAGVALVASLRERWAPAVALIGCVGCLSELVAAH